MIALLACLLCLSIGVAFACWCSRDSWLIRVSYPRVTLLWPVLAVVALVVLLADALKERES